MFEHGVSGISYAFGTRSAGWPAAIANGASLRVVSLNQVHGADVLVIKGQTDQAVQEAAARGYDAVVTDQRQTFLTIRTADCVPMLLIDPTVRVVAAVHAGWRGTLKGIGPETLRVMRDRFGCQISSVRVAIGPSIGGCCYEVDDLVMASVKRAYSYWREVLDERKGGRALLDLRRLNRRQMEEAGVDSGRIETVNLCTACHPEFFYSYRRDGRDTAHLISGIALV